MEKGTESGSVLLGDSGESMNLGSSDEVEHECFYAVIEVVGSEDMFCAIFLAYRFEESISFDTGCFFDSFFRDESHPGNILFFSDKNQSI